MVLVLQTLLDLGLPANAIVAALGGFNIGVELGQLVIVLVFLPLAWLLRRTFVYRWLVVVGGSIVIILIGTYWILERSGITI
jgi:long-subunit acyl-CoA synthetase (AMP-forming)